MCGIAGIVRFDGAPVNAEAVRGMVRTLRHRGPDSNAVHVSNGVGLGHARLQVIDLATGEQPMSTEDQGLWITFNGEIFNYLELRDELAARGHRFLTRSDTEVILHLYQEYGDECVHHLNGQWAFAIWDAPRRRLFLSRDRMGVLPLFYAHTPGGMIFASEIKAIFSDPSVPRSIDVTALDQLFTFWTTIPPRTPFAGISELPPGHSLTVHDRRVSVHRYWQLDYPEPLALSDEEAGEQLLDLLNDSTRLRLRADVPVGAYLSGGLDSTTVTALAKQYVSAPPATFSVSFESPEYDERSYQRDAVAYLGTQHHDHLCRASDIARAFRDVVWHAEKPLLRTAPAPLFLLSQAVRDSGYKVVLTGEGADEIFGGYDLYKEVKIRQFIDARPESKFRGELLRRLYPYMPMMGKQSRSFLQSFFVNSQRHAGDIFSSHRPRWQVTSHAKRLYSADVKAQLGGYDPVEELRGALPSQFPGWNEFTRAQYLETAFLLPGYILAAQGDRMAMGHGIEGRFPFLDHRVVEFANALPIRMKMRVLNEKYLLKRVVRGLIPESVRVRSKQPYRAPGAEVFFAERGLSGDYEELLSVKRVTDDGLFDPSAVQLLIAKARSGAVTSARDTMALTGVLSTQLLVDMLIRRSPSGSHPQRDSGVRD
jgi:asparagine synthase (glutamine-hydrolysing)